MLNQALLIKAGPQGDGMTMKYIDLDGNMECSSTDKMPSTDIKFGSTLINIGSVVISFFFGGGVKM